MGKGSVVKNGRLIKFVANLTPPPISPDDIDGVKPESRPLGDRVTVAETPDISTSELSPESELSPVTLPKNVVADVQQNVVAEEVEEVEEATLLEQTDATSADESEELEAIAPMPVEQVDATSADDSEEAIASKPQEVWAWSKVTGESLGEVLSISRTKGAKIRRSGEIPRYAKFYPLQEITFDNPVVQALSFNAPPATPAQWEDSEQFLEEFED